MSDRKAELERKKQRLQQMREEKKRKEEERRRKEAENEAMKTKEPSKDLRAETEQMLKDLGIPPAGANQTATQAQLSLSREGSQDSRENAPLPQVYASPRPKVKLSASKINQTNIPPRETVSYSKETQTPHETVEKEASTSTLGSRASTSSPKFVFPHLEWDNEFDDTEDEDNDSLDVGVDTPPAYPPSAAPPIDGTTAPAEPEPPKEEEKPPVRELTEEERKQILNSEDFLRFFDRASRIVERAMFEEVNLFQDYGAIDSEEKEGGLAEGEKLKLTRQFYDERWSRFRTVTCLDWSVQHPELLVASYNMNEDAPQDPDGVALIWNTKFKKSTPEYIFHCQSAVMSCCFAKFHPNLVIGGTYSGQIVLWDNRSNKRTPVQRTPLSAAAHTHPVYCVNVIGTQNAHNLISVSTDGKMCSWSLDMLSQPQDSMELQYKQAKAVAVTSYSFISGDVNNFVVGSEEGAVYTACRHGSKAGIGEVFEGHYGPVTGIDCHAVPGQVDFSPYFLSSSFDWTVKLWNMKENKPLHSFEDNSDYIYDVKWSPIHPALFATVDGMGRLDLWNLNNDIEVPTASTFVEGNVSLNRCRWHQSGHQIAVGDDMGKIHIYDVGEPIANPKNDEWSKFVHTIQEIRNNRAEQEEDSRHMSSLSASPLR